jgi:NAD(P)-dependent dehydrogenase (short-subunit alcohol dehydrogenase family)
MAEDHSDGCAVIVGATGTLGGAIARRLLERGVPVVAVARTRESLEALAAESDLVTPCVADVASDDAIATIRAAVPGRVRMALTAAGLPVRGSALTIETDGLARAVNIKLGGLQRLLRAVDDRLGKGSRIVALSGFLAAEPKTMEAGPGVVNAALHNLMRQLSGMYGPRGVTVHTISPGSADTERLRRIARASAEERGIDFDTQWQEYLDESSLGRLIQVDEVAWAAGLLLDREADALHGSTLSLDGGRLKGIF